MSLKHEKLSEAIIGAAIEVHRELGPGLLESTYELCFAHELHRLSLSVRRQAPLPVEYKGVKLDCGYRADMIVNDAILLELKSVQKLEPVHEAQLHTYLRLSGITVGLLMNFNVTRMTDGITRRVL